MAACLLAQSCGARTAPGSSVKVASGDGWTGYCTGNCGKDGLPVYKNANPTSGVVLMGGSSDVDAAFLWQISKADGGDFLVLRHSGSDGYNDYIYDELSGETVNSVFSVVLDSVAASSDPVVVAAVQNADALFFAGGDQTLYVQRMPLGSPLALALAERAPSITVGGTSAGNDFLSPIIFAPATDAGDITSKIALADPFAYGIDFSATVLHLDSFGTNDTAWFADAHFEERDRMGRDLTFLARLHQDGLVPAGQCARFVAVNERTAMVVERVRLPRGETAVTGATHAYVCELCAAPTTCEAGQPLSAGPYSCLRLSVGDTFMFQDWSSQQGVTYELSVEDGVVVGDAYGPPEQAVAPQAEQEAEPLRSCIIPEVVQGVQATESPVIGVVSQSLEVEMGADPRFAPYKDGSYIMKAYVQWLQAAGARVVPLVRGEPEDETLRKLAGVNGVLFPGGDGDYEEFGRFIFNAVRAQNDAGNYLPLWGTCMGAFSPLALRRELCRVLTPFLLQKATRICCHMSQRLGGTCWMCTTWTAPPWLCSLWLTRRRRRCSAGWARTRASSSRTTWPITRTIGQRTRTAS